MEINSIQSIQEFRKFFNSRIRGLSKDSDGLESRIKKFYDLLENKNLASPIASVDKKSLRRIAIVLTTHCNLKCVWCHREESHVKESGYLSKNLDKNQILKLLPTLKGFHVLSWGGLGEPLINKDIYELTKEARKYIPIVKTTSNGTTLTKKNILKIVDSGLNYLEVSIDGFDKDANKKLRGSDENIIIENLYELSDKSEIPIQINTVVSKENYKSLFKAVEKLKDVKNIICMHAIPLFMTKHMEDLGIQKLSNLDFKNLLASWRKDINKFGLNWELSPSEQEVTLDPVTYMKKEHNICFTPFEDPTINVDGEIVPCSRLQHIGLGNVMKEGFEKAWNSSKMQKFRQEQLNGNYGRLCQRECNMKVTCKENEQLRKIKLKEIHKTLET